MPLTLTKHLSLLSTTMFCHAHLPRVDLLRISSVSILSGEHEVILQTLCCLEKIAALSIQNNHIPEEHASQVLRILRQFADRCHHGKEEDVLFPAMEARHPDFEPIAVMRAEHVQGRAYIAGMVKALDHKDPHDFAQQALAYIELLRQHIEKENEVLFPLAQDMLSAEEDEQILEAYRTIEHEDIGTGVHEQLLNLANSLAQSYGVPVASNAPNIMKLLTAICGCKKTNSVHSKKNPFAELEDLAIKVRRAHGDQHPQMVELAQIIHTLAITPPATLPLVLKPHQAELANLTDNYRPWLGACGSVAMLFNSLRNLTA